MTNIQNFGDFGQGNQNPNKKTMSSREIAEMTGKRHDHVLRDIRNMEPAWEKITKTKFGVSEYKDSTGRKLPMYELTKKESLYVATKFNDEARAILVNRWEELEAKEIFNIHSAPKDMILAKAFEILQGNVKALEEQNKILETVIEEQQPQVLFAKSVSASKTTILIGELAKIIKQNGVDMGQNRLFDWLRNKGFLISRKGTDYNMPTQKSMDLGLFEIKETNVIHSDGHISINKTPKVTGKGQQYFINKFLNKEVTV